MGLQFQPRIGTVVLCDFRGMIEPEMVKKREVVIVATHRHNSKLVTVVPLSSTEPAALERYHHQLSKNPRPDGEDVSIWVKCDMIYTVCLERLDMHYTRTRRGGRQSIRVTLPADDVAKVRASIAAALQLPYTEDVPERGLESGSAPALTQPG